MYVHTYVYASANHLLRVWRIPICIIPIRWILFDDKKNAETKRLHKTFLCKKAQKKKIVIQWSD